MRSVITGTGSYIPTVVKKNNEFLGTSFFSEDGVLINTDTTVIIEKFKKITGILERRYAPSHLKTSDMAALAGELAIDNSNIDR